MTVLDNVAFSPRVRGVSRREARATASGWFAALGPGIVRRSPPSRSVWRTGPAVALARALAGNPALLLLDEPLSALDARTRLDVQSELSRHLADFGGPCLLVTHDPLEALVLADRLLVLEDGRIVQAGTPAQIARRPATEYVARFGRPEPLQRKGRRGRSEAPRLAEYLSYRPRPARRRARSAAVRPRLSSASSVRTPARATPGRRQSWA
jgi:ABC-type sulfate/molybdate transport systems ATPase subunit